jgi:hypothetical protein
LPTTFSKGCCATGFGRVKNDRRDFASIRVYSGAKMFVKRCIKPWRNLFKRFFKSCLKHLRLENRAQKRREPDVKLRPKNPPYLGHKRLFAPAGGGSMDARELSVYKPLEAIADFSEGE